MRFPNQRFLCHPGTSAFAGGEDVRQYRILPKSTEYEFPFGFFSVVQDDSTTRAKLSGGV